MKSNSGFDDYMDKLKKVKLPNDRKNLKPVDPHLSFEQYLAQATMEGFALLAAEEKNSVKKPQIPAKPSPILEDALGKMSSNVYVRARTQVLTKMSPLLRKQIEKMENTKDLDNRIYREFVRAVVMLGDKLSS